MQHAERDTRGLFSEADSRIVKVITFLGGLWNQGLGHPEMCTRPCLFFAAGQCQNRESCEFCHLPHNRRPTHLDKRNRELLKSFSSEEKLATILPILSEKLQKYCNNPAAFQLLLQLETLSANSGVDLEAMSTTSSKQTAKGERTLKSALRAVTLRSLLTLLLRTLPKDDHVRHVVEAMICSLRQPEWRVSLSWTVSGIDWHCLQIGKMSASDEFVPVDLLNIEIQIDANSRTIELIDNNYGIERNWIDVICRIYPHMPLLFTQPCRVLAPGLCFGHSRLRERCSFRRAVRQKHGQRQESLSPMSWMLRGQIGSDRIR